MRVEAAGGWGEALHRAANGKSRRRRSSFTESLAPVGPLPSLSGARHTHPSLLPLVSTTAEEDAEND